jgi:hypothetical protein
MRGYPHSYEPEEAMKVELWVGHPERVDIDDVAVH